MRQTQIEVYSCKYQPTILKKKTQKTRSRYTKKIWDSFRLKEPKEIWKQCNMCPRWILDYEKIVIILGQLTKCKYVPTLN